MKITTIGEIISEYENPFVLNRPHITSGGNGYWEYANLTGKVPEYGRGSGNSWAAAGLPNLTGDPENYEPF